MARIDWIEERLQNWARWRLAAGSGSIARVNLLAADMPREAYADKPIPISDCEASETDEAVGRLPGELRMTVIEIYTGAGGLRDKLRRLCCPETTALRRVDQAHRLLAGHFMARQDRAKAERARLNQLGAGV